MRLSSSSSRLSICMRAHLLQPCLTLCDPMDCSPLGSSVCGILQARILDWLPCSPTGILLQTYIQICIVSRGFLEHPQVKNCLICSSHFINTEATIYHESIHTRRQSKDYYPHFPDLEIKVKSQEKLQDLPVVLKLVNSSSRTQDPGLV